MTAAGHVTVLPESGPPAEDAPRAVVQLIPRRRSRRTLPYRLWLPTLATAPRRPPHQPSPPDDEGAADGRGLPWTAATSDAPLAAAAAVRAAHTSFPLATPLTGPAWCPASGHFFPSVHGYTRPSFGTDAQPAPRVVWRREAVLAVRGERPFPPPGIAAQKPAHVVLPDLSPPPPPPAAAVTIVLAVRRAAVALGRGAAAGLATDGGGGGPRSAAGFAAPHTLPIALQGTA